MKPNVPRPSNELKRAVEEIKPSVPSPSKELKSAADEINVDGIEDR
jgi:hypothetical protein